MAGIFDFGAGTGMLGGLPDWLWQDPQLMAGRPNGMEGGTPAGSFDERWGPVLSALKTGAFDPQGGNFSTAYGGQPQAPSMAMAYDAPGATGGQQPLAGMAPRPAPGGYGGDLASGAPPATIGAPPPQAPFPSLPQAPVNPGISDRLGAGLMGFANAGGPLPAIANLIGGLATGQRQDPAGRAERTQDQSRAAVYQAVLKATGDQAQALAAASNPEVFKALAPDIFGSPKIVKVGSNPITGDQYMMQKGGKLMPLPDASGGGGSAASAPGTNGMLAQGVGQYNPNLSGEEYLAQFGPEVQAAVKAYIKGDVMPTGNPRLQGIAAIAKTIAQKYGADIGVPVSDARYSEMRKYRTELGSNSATTAGGQAKAFVQGIEHADTLANKLEGLQNWNGLGIPFLAAGANTIREAFSTNQKGLSAEAKAIGQTLAGEVGKLFSGSAGGGVHEREMTRQRFNTISSGPELAGALEGTIETMEGGLKALESRRDQVLGPNNDVQFITKETEAKISHIREIIQRLKTGEAPSKPDAATSAPQDGSTATNPKTGEKRILRGGKWVPVNPAGLGNVT